MRLHLVSAAICRYAGELCDGESTAIEPYRFFPLPHTTGSVRLRRGFTLLGNFFNKSMHDRKSLLVLSCRVVAATAGEGIFLLNFLSYAKTAGCELSSRPDAKV